MSRRRIGWALLGLAVLAAFGGSLLGSRLVRGPEASREGGHSRGGPQVPAEARRIVSLAPSVTEVAFAVGCGERLVGATRYCTYPEGARRIPRIGGYSDPSMEAVIGRRPDLVIGNVGVDHGPLREALGRLGVPVLLVDQGNMEGLLSSFRQIGQVCGAKGAAEAEAKVADLRARLARVREKTRDRPARRVLVVFGRGGQVGTLGEVYVAGRGGLYDEVIALAGGDNAYWKPIPAFPRLTVEGILQIDPDVIVELASGAMGPAPPRAELEESWRALPGLSAARAGRIRVVTGNIGEVPGPRLFQLVEEVAAAAHPEVDWGRP